MPETSIPAASLATVMDAPTRIADALRAYHGEVGGIDGPPGPSTGLNGDHRTGLQSTRAEQVAALKQQVMAELKRLENTTEQALADARSRLEAAILPTMSPDPQVQRLFDLRTVKAAARLQALFRQAQGGAAVDEAVRQFADEAARTGDWAMLAVLRAEIGPQLERRQIEAGTSQASRIIEQTVLAVRPRSAGPLAERQALEAGAARVAVAFTQARGAVERDEREVVLPGYERGVSESVSLPAVE
jgi:hypothetical protein